MRLGAEWIRTHDLAGRDADGYYWYQRPNDDFIKSAGYRIGPAEVEEALLRHPAVADVGVIGVPADTGDRGYIVKAFGGSSFRYRWQPCARSKTMQPREDAHRALQSAADY